MDGGTHSVAAVGFELTASTECQHSGHLLQRIHQRRHCGAERCAALGLKVGFAGTAWHKAKVSLDSDEVGLWAGGLGFIGLDSRKVAVLACGTMVEQAGAQADKSLEALRGLEGGAMMLRTSGCTIGGDRGLGALPVL